MSWRISMSMLSSGRSLGRVASPALVLLALSASASGKLYAQGQSVAPRIVATAGAPRIYIPPQEGFESYISAAIVKKHVPAVVTQDKEEARFLLTSAVDAKRESTGSIVARCLFLYCAGVAGTQTATVQLVNAKTHEVAWAYNVQKGSAQAYQSTAEAIAKHLKKFLEEHPQ
jgi:hypothetical protein